MQEFTLTIQQINELLALIGHAQDNEIRGIDMEQLSVLQDTLNQIVMHQPEKVNIRANNFDNLFET